MSKTTETILIVDINIINNVFSEYAQPTYVYATI